MPSDEAALLALADANLEQLEAHAVLKGARKHELHMQVATFAIDCLALDEQGAETFTSKVAEFAEDATLTDLEQFSVHINGIRSLLGEKGLDERVVIDLVPEPPVLLHAVLSDVEMDSIHSLEFDTSSTEVDSEEQETPRWFGERELGALKKIFDEELIEDRLGEDISYEHMITILDNIESALSTVEIHHNLGLDLHLQNLRSYIISGLSWTEIATSQGKSAKNAYLGMKQIRKLIETLSIRQQEQILFNRKYDAVEKPDIEVNQESTNISSEEINFDEPVSETARYILEAYDDSLPEVVTKREANNILNTLVRIWGTSRLSSRQISDYTTRFNDLIIDGLFAQGLAEIEGVSVENYINSILESISFAVRRMPENNPQIVSPTETEPVTTVLTEEITSDNSNEALPSEPEESIALVLATTTEDENCVPEVVVTDLPLPKTNPVKKASATTSPKPGKRVPTRRGAESHTTSSYDNDSLKIYLREIGKHTLLTKEDEVMLAKEIEAGTKLAKEIESAGVEPSPEQLAIIQTGKDAKTRFVNSNLRLVVSIAKRYRPPIGIELLDMIQEGNFGLEHAVDKFEWRKGFKFSTYSTWWIKQAITRYLANNNSLIRIPVHMNDEVRAELKLVDNDPKRLSQKYLRVYQLMNPAFLDKEYGDDGDATMYDFVGDHTYDPEAEAVQESSVAEAKTLIERSMERLNASERLVIEMRHGINGYEVSTLEVTGNALGITRERARQLQARAEARMREVLRPHVDF